MTGPSRLFAKVSLASGAAFSALAAYFFVTSLGLENPLTHTFPLTFDYFAYARYYYQTEANFEICWKLSAALFALSFLSFSFPSLERLAVFKPLRGAFAFFRRRSLRFKTLVLAVPLVLLETGLVLYGGLMGLESLDLPLAVSLRQEPVARALFLGPLAAFGAPSAAAQDYYFLALLLGVALGSWYRFGSARRVVQMSALSIATLPTLVYLFDPLEFNTFFASVVFSAGLGWFSNAVLLYLSVGVFVAATAYPAVQRFAFRFIRR